MPLSKILPSGVSQPTPVNAIINGNMSVAQRGTSSTGLGNTADSYQTLDRWKLSADTSAATAGRLTMSQDSSAPSGFGNSLKLACTTADTSIASGELCALFQPIEGQNLQAFAKGTADAKPFAVSFYVKGNASATYMLELKDTDNTRLIHRRFSVTTDWTRIEVSFPKDTTGAFDNDNAKSLELRIFLHAGSNYTSGTYTADTWASQTSANRAVGISSFFDSTNRTFFITGVQLTAGSHHHDFIHESFAETLAKCQRYLWCVDATDDTGGSGDRSLGIGTYYNSTSVIVFVDTPVQMRSAPTLSVVLNGSSTWLQSYVGASGNDSNAGLNVGQNGPNTAHRLYFTSAHSGMTAGQSSWNQVRDDAKFFMSAEL